MKNQYYNFKIGEIVTLNETILSEGNIIDRGTNFEIKEFLPTLRKSKGHKYFIYGFSKEHTIRCEIDQIIKR